MKMKSRGYASAFLHFGLLANSSIRKNTKNFWRHTRQKPAAEARNFVEFFFYATVFKRLIDAVPRRRIALLLRF
jgi:hypothetical protein